MPALTPGVVRKQIEQGKPDPVYLIIGDDEVQMNDLANGLGELVEEDLRAFCLQRMHATDKGVTASTIAQAAQTLPMLGDRRVVIVLHAERILKPKRKGKPAEAVDADDDDGEAPSDLEALENYLKNSEPRNTLVLVAADADRQRKVYKALQKHASIVECYGLKGSRDARVDLRQVARTAEAIVKQTVIAGGQQIDAAASRLVAERAGTDITRLRADLDRVLLYTAGKPKITLDDVHDVVSSETAQDDWAVTNAITQGNTAEALRLLGLALEGGGVSYQILGQLGWFVRERLVTADPRRVPAAVEALFRTDLDLKSSGGDPRVLLERLVVELCRR
ncbi:MAG: hypothetical protein H0W53_00590 [Acidobacteria bacterium]|nr:hypothetical protein [Acidobacteriota bacterium]